MAIGDGRTTRLDGLSHPAATWPLGKVLGQTRPFGRRVRSHGVRRKSYGRKFFESCQERLSLFLVKQVKQL